MQKKIIPNPTDSQLLPPSDNYFYFECFENFPFEYNAESHSFINQWWLSEASHIVYSKPNHARMIFNFLGLTKFKAFVKGATECFVASNDKFAICTFRGTEIKSLNFLSDVIADINFIQERESSGGAVHRGFKIALDEIWDNDQQHFKAYLDSLKSENPDIKIWMTGHSLGAAVATIAAVRYGDVAGLYTFGSPKVGDAAFISKFKFYVARVTNTNDPIPLLPPSFNIKKDRRFAHIGENIHFSLDGKIVDNETEHLVAALKDTGKNLGGFMKKYFNEVKEVSKSTLKTVFNNKSNDSEIQKLSMTDIITNFHDIWGEHVRIDMINHSPLIYSINSWNSLIERVKFPE